MPAWVWVVIAIVVVVIAAVAWNMVRRGRTAHLQGQFGPEYDRAVEDSDNRKQAEAELAARERRHQQFELRALAPDARERYLGRWHDVQTQFVDDPRAAVAAADTLIQSAMHERGYPVEDFDQRAADLSVDHPAVVEHYREGHTLAQQSARGEDTTENLRLAMQHYRALFEDLVNSAADGANAAGTARTRAVTTAKER
jgi:hypothetical protein